MIDPPHNCLSIIVMIFPVVSLTKRTILIFGFVATIAALVLTHTAVQTRPGFLSWDETPETDISSNVVLEDPEVHQRVERLRQECLSQDPFEKEYGRTNLRLSRAYEGSHFRLRKLLHKTLRGEPIIISAIGGSVTKGHHVNPNEIWFYRFGQWLQDFIGNDVPITHVNGAAPATGSDYFSFCFPLHIPTDSDLVLVELAINDQGILEHVENMENLLRGLLDLPTRPAVILVEAIAFSNGGMGGGGGRMHLPVAQYYDVPVINQRHPLVNHFARFPQLQRSYFAEDGWGYPDTRHINSHGHRDLGMLIASLVRDAACEMVAELGFIVPKEELALAIDLQETNLPVYISTALAMVNESVSAKDLAAVQDSVVATFEKGWPDQTHAWRESPDKDAEVGGYMPGLWMGPHEYGQMPRLRVLEGWNPDPKRTTPPFHPMCFSIRSQNPKFNLTPAAREGWDYWAHPDHADKPYLISQTPGSTVTFRLETSLGVVKMYSLRSKTFGLGTVECWADDERDRAVKVEGYWNNGNANIGRFNTIRTDLQPGLHDVTCELLNETADPGGGHEFRMISIMSV